MKDIVINVPDEFVVPQSIKGVDAHKVITIGDMMYSQGFVFLSENDPVLLHKLDTMSQQHDKELQAMEQRATLSKMHHDDHMKNMICLNTSLQDKLERLSIEHMKSINDIRRESSDLVNQMRIEKDTLHAKVSENNTDILNKIDSLLGNGNTIDNIEKGNFGENYVSSMIIQEFPDAFVDDVSNETAHCDCVWRMDSGAFRCLVEVKNVAQSKNLNIDKFVRDMNINLSNGEANCGIFVSLKTDNIPNKGKFKLEYLQGYPLLYISGVWKSPIILTFALRMMRCIIQNSTQDDGHVMDTVQINEYITKTYNTIVREQSIISDMRKSMDRMNMLLQKSQKNLTESIVYMEESMTKHNIMSHESEYTHEKEDSIASIHLFHDTHGRWPVSSESGVSKHICKKYTFKNLLQEAKSL